VAAPRRIVNREELERVLADPEFEVTTVDGGRAGIAWLRASVCRFANGETHARRRGLVEEELARMDPDELRARARERAERVLAHSGGELETMGELARAVPLAVLARALGVSEGELPEAVEAATIVGGAYLGGEGDERADAAVERLSQLLPRADAERSAAALAVLAQACEATAALIGNALVLSGEREQSLEDVEALLAETLRAAAPLRVMRRVSRGGEAIVIDLEAASSASEPGQRPLTFGGGLRPCPGEREALALARGVLEALLPSCTVVTDGLACVVSPVFRLPACVELRSAAQAEAPGVTR
jgi:cytochrome P450